MKIGIRNLFNERLSFSDCHHQCVQMQCTCHETVKMLILI